MKLPLAQATASKKAKKQLKKNKKLSTSQKFRSFLKAQPLLLIAFVLVFAGAGTYLLLRSRAATLVGSWCDKSYVEIPGGGLVLSEPTVTQVFNQVNNQDNSTQRWKMIVVARGLDNAVWYTTMDSASLVWRNEWKSLGGQTKWPPKIINYKLPLSNTVFGKIVALGTDDKVYNLDTTNTGWSSWKFVSADPTVYFNTLNNTTEKPSNYTYNVRKFYNDQHVYYNCYR
jgi:hypothetical protein